MTLAELQSIVAEWHRRHFPDVDTTRIVLKTVEEAGELCKARERRMSGHPGAVAAEQDAVGDILVCLAALCAWEGYDLNQIAQATLDEIEARDHARVVGT